jgi:hypothetical protein
MYDFPLTDLLQNSLTIQKFPKVESIAVLNFLLQY